MVDLSDVESVRTRLAALCRMPAHRAHPPNIPTSRHRWQPFAVQDRATLSWFTDIGAWELISELLLQGIPVSYLPPTDEFPDHAYVMIDRNHGMEDIYIKIALCPATRTLLGISFHYAYR